MPQDMNSDPGGQGLSDMSVAKSTSDSTQEDSARIGEQVRRQGSQGAEQIKDSARGLTGKAREQVARYADRQKSTVTDQINSIAQAIRQAGEELERNQQGQASRLADQAAGGLESLSRTIDDADIQDVLNSVRRFGRSNPAIFIGGAVVAGLALARFARASGRSHYSSQGGGSWQGGGRSQSGQGSTWPDAQQSSRGSYGSSQYGSGGSGAAGSFRTGGAASYGASGATGGGGLGTAAAAAGGLGSGTGGSRSSGSGQGSFPSGTTGGAPGSAQGYAGGGMGTDPIQSSAGSGRTSTPSSATDPSVGGSSSGSGTSSGAISTGESS